MYQAITTRFLGPTNYRGSRYKATCAAGSITITADDRLDYTENHKRAAQALINKLGWFHNPDRGDRDGQWFGGAIHKGGYAFVCGRDTTEVFPPDDHMVRHTACKHCRSDIEGMYPYRAGEWRDRGNNTNCDAYTSDKHEPVTNG